MKLFGKQRSSTEDLGTVSPAGGAQGVCCPLAVGSLFPWSQLKDGVVQCDPALSGGKKNLPPYLSWKSK